MNINKTPSPTFDRHFIGNTRDTSPRKSSMKKSASNSYNTNEYRKPVDFNSTSPMFNQIKYFCSF
jgi:hypothetical protein